MFSRIFQLISSLPSSICRSNGILYWPCIGCSTTRSSGSSLSWATYTDFNLSSVLLECLSFTELGLEFTPSSSQVSTRLLILSGGCTCMRYFSLLINQGGTIHARKTSILIQPMAENASSSDFGFRFCLENSAPNVKFIIDLPSQSRYMEII